MNYICLHKKSSPNLEVEEWLQIEIQNPVKQIASMSTLDEFKQFVGSINNALNNSATDYEQLFSEDEWGFESPVVIKTPSERSAKAIKSFLEKMVFIPSSDKNLSVYQIRDNANYFDNIPAPDCLHDFCIHEGINSNITEELGFGMFAFTKPSQAVSFVDYLTSVTGYKFEIALEEEIIWARRLGRGFSPLVSGTSAPILSVDKNGNNVIMIYNDKYGENISVNKIDEWNKPYDFYVVCKSKEFVDKQLSIFGNIINETFEEQKKEMSSIFDSIVDDPFDDE